MNSLYTSSARINSQRAVTLITPPALEPLRIDETKLHLRLDSNDELYFLRALIVAVRKHCEQLIARALLTQTWELVQDNWPVAPVYELPFPRLQSVSSIKYKDKDGLETTWPQGNYIVDTDFEPGRISLAYGKTYPSTTLYPIAAIRTRYVAGYGPKASDVPEPIRHAMLLMIGHLFEHREAVELGQSSLIVAEIPMAFKSLLAPYRLFSFGEDY